MMKNLKSILAWLSLSLATLIGAYGGDEVFVYHNWTFDCTLNPSKASTAQERQLSCDVNRTQYGKAEKYAALSFKSSQSVFNTTTQTYQMFCEFSAVNADEWPRREAERYLAQTFSQPANRYLTGTKGIKFAYPASDGTVKDGWWCELRPLNKKRTEEIFTAPDKVDLNALSFDLQWLENTAAKASMGSSEELSTVPEGLWSNQNIRGKFILEALPLIHVTNVAPKDHVLRHGAIEPNTQQDWSQTAQLMNLPRATLHWTLGDMVQSHEGGNWDRHKIAIISRLQGLGRPVGSLHPYDSFSYGDYKLRPGVDVYVVPLDYFTARYKEASKQLGWQDQEGFSHYVYDDKTRNLRQALHQALKDQGRYFYSFSNSKDPVLLDGQQIDTLEFFKPAMAALSAGFGQHQLNTSLDNTWFYIQEQGARWLRNVVNEYVELCDASVRRQPYDKPSFAAMLSYDFLLLMKLSQQKILNSRYYKVLNDDYKNILAFYADVIDMELTLRIQHRGDSIFDIYLYQIEHEAYFVDDLLGRYVHPIEQALRQTKDIASYHQNKKELTVRIDALSLTNTHMFCLDLDEVSNWHKVLFFQTVPKGQEPLFFNEYFAALAKLNDELNLAIEEMNNKPSLVRPHHRCPLNPEKLTEAYQQSVIKNSRHERAKYVGY